MIDILQTAETDVTTVNADVVNTADTIGSNVKAIYTNRIDDIILAVIMLAAIYLGHVL